MKNRLAKIFSFLSLAVYGIMLLAFLLGRLDLMLDYDSSNPPLIKILKYIGDISNFVFMFTLCLGWLLALPFSIAGIVFWLLSKNKGKSDIPFFASALGCCFALPWAVIMGNFFLVPPLDAPKPSPVYDIAWHFLDESIQGQKILLSCTEKYSEKPKIVKKSLIAGKTKKIRLPDKFFNQIEGCSKTDQSVRAFVPYGFFINWREDEDRYVKREAYEVILYKKPEIIEDEEKFVMQTVPKAEEFQLCYWDRTRHRFVHSLSSDGVFYKKNQSDDLLWDLEKKYPDSDEKFNLFMKVKSSVDADRDFLITVPYDRDERFRPTKVYRTYNQDGREITTLNMELDGTNWVSTRFVNRNDEPIAHAKAVIYVIFEEDRYTETGEMLSTEIYTESDDDGWVKVQNLPDGTECYINFED